MKHLGFPQLGGGGENVVFWHKREHGGCRGLCSMQVVSSKGTRGEGDQEEEASWTSPGAPSTAREAWTRLCCHSEHVGDSVAHVPARCKLGKHCLCQKPRREGSQSRHRTPD